MNPLHDAYMASSGIAIGALLSSIGTPGKASIVGLSFAAAALALDYAVERFVLTEETNE